VKQGKEFYFPAFFRGAWIPRDKRPASRKPSFSHSQKMDRYCGSPKFFPKSDVNCARIAELRLGNFNSSGTIPAAKPLAHSDAL
jgi:hypothetical protein